jgi:hypothetical protein
LSGTDAKRTVEWDFFCTNGRNSGEWTKIQVPSNWELQGFGNYNYGHDWKDSNKKLGVEHGLYKYEFEVLKSWKGKSVKIVFDGSMTDTKVSINGKQAGEIHQGAFNRFSYDVTKLLKYGQSNLLEVDVAKHSGNESVNQAERQADFWIFGGIYRPVFLEVCPANFMQRVAIDARANGSFKVLAEINNVNVADDVQVELFRMNGEKLAGIFKTSIAKGVSEVEVDGRFEGVRAWNPESPTLYDMRISLMKNGRAFHMETKRIGFRTVELRRHDGFYVNGKKVIFKGVDRHSFWPETGRALSDENHKMDIRLMKEMNMNAVRMSHYAPDERFLDLCDSLGLFVLDELTGWQDGYDTIVGPKRVRELVLKDENHPSVVIWDHGNEGGWDFANEKWFHIYDIQKRPVIYPWLNRNGVDTHHYNSYDFGINRYYYGNDVFMPTELLHGLYDGGHGAGLYDFWTRFRSNPRAAGGFLWVFSDEAVLRRDKEGKVYDSDGTHAPDGILGPHREKEASFYTIRELWSPVQIEPVVISPGWDGRLLVKNDYIYTNLNTVSFQWKAVKTRSPGGAINSTVASGTIKGPNAEPGETRIVLAEFDEEFKKSDVFSLTAVDKDGKEICSWSWPVQHPKDIVERVMDDFNLPTGEIVVEEGSGRLTASVQGMKYVFDLEKGKLTSVENADGKVSFSGGPTPVGLETKIGNLTWKMDDDQNLVIRGSYDPYPSYFFWKVHKNGLLELETGPNLKSLRDIDFLGVSFNYPEENVKSMQWLGNGPYRVWKNRMHGTNFNLWEKEYNNTITGESFNNLIYPEFKGYHAHMNWARLETTESPINILVETPNIFMQVFAPDPPAEISGGTVPPFPDGDISFLYEIPAIGTKFKKATELGPSGQKGIDNHHRGDDNDPIRVWFDFSGKN